MSQGIHGDHDRVLDGERSCRCVEKGTGGKLENHTEGGNTGVSVHTSEQFALLRVVAIGCYGVSSFVSSQTPDDCHVQRRLAATKFLDREMGILGCTRIGSCVGSSFGYEKER